MGRKCEVILSLFIVFQQKLSEKKIENAVPPAVGSNKWYNFFEPVKPFVWATVKEKEFYCPGNQETR